MTRPDQMVRNFVVQCPVLGFLKSDAFGVKRKGKGIDAIFQLKHDLGSIKCGVVPRRAAPP